MSLDVGCPVVDANSFSLVFSYLDPLTSRRVSRRLGFTALKRNNRIELHRQGFGVDMPAEMEIFPNARWTNVQNAALAWLKNTFPEDIGYLSCQLHNHRHLKIGLKRIIIYAQRH